MSIFNGKSPFGLSFRKSFFPFSSQSLWKKFSSTVIFNLFQIIIVSLFLAHHDQCFIMFKDSNIFQFTNFLFRTKDNNTVLYSVNRNCLFSRGKQKKLKTIWLDLLCIYEYFARTRWFLKGVLIDWWSLVSLEN